MSNMQIRFAQVDPAAKADIATITASDKSPWSVLNDLKYDNMPEPGNYATFEHNFWILDGTKDIFPEDTSNRTWGLWTNSMSDENGNFSFPSTLTIEFSVNHKAPGLTFGFYPGTSDFVREVKITWYDSSSTEIITGTYTMTSDLTAIDEAVEDFRKITIEFVTTAIPYRYVKLYRIDIGRIRIIYDEEIDTCNIYEEIDPTIESIGINTLNSQIRTLNPFFSPLSSAVADDMMMKRQMLKVTRDGEEFGTFFLRTWEDIDNSGLVFNFECDDAMSVLDSYTFMGGLYDNVLASDILDEIFRISFPTGIINYDLDKAYTESTVSGWIPICPCGTAFQHIMFALNAIADTSRQGNLLIYPRDIYSTFSLPLEEQYRGGSTKPTTYYSGVDVTAYKYVKGQETVTPQSGTLEVGQYEIRFAEPLHTLSLTGQASILETHVNYAVIRVTVKGDVVLTGRRYVNNELIKSSRREISSGEVENIKSYEGYTLTTHDIGKDLADKKLEYLENRLEFETDMVLGNREVGYIINAETKVHDFTGIITSLDINLRPDKATMIAIGHVYEPIVGFDFTNMAYTGNYI